MSDKVLDPTDPKSPAKVSPAAPRPVATPKSGTETVTIGCKLPHGIILQLYDDPASPDGPCVPKGDPVVINGYNSSRVIGGHGITRGVRLDFWEEWIKKNANFAPVKSKLLFAHDDTEDAEDEAEERKDNKSGFEGMKALAPSDKQTGNKGVFETDEGVQPQMKVNQ